MNKRYAMPFLAAILAACSGGEPSAPKAGPPAKIVVVSGSSQSASAGEAISAPLIAKVTDANNAAVSKAVVTFTIASGGGTLSQAVDTTDSEGNASVTWTVGGTLGEGKVQARTTGVLVPAEFTATINAGAPSQLSQISDPVGASAANFDAGDSVAVRLMDKFNNPVANTAVTFAVTAGGGKVSAATKTTDASGVARTMWTMGATGSQTMRATSGTVNVDVTANAATCNETTMAVGQVVSLTGNAAQCVVLNGNAKNFIITVVNSTNGSTSTAPYRGRGALGSTSTVANVDAPESSSVASSVTGERLGQNVNEDGILAGRRAHAAILERNLEALPQIAASFKKQGALHNNNIVMQMPPPNVGDTVNMTFNFQNCQASPSSNVRARVVYVGTRGVMLEDVANPAAGQMDTLYADIGKEFDDVMYPILLNNYGDPLAMDTQLNNDGHLFMLFTTRVNGLQDGNIGGFVTSNDFNSKSVCPASNFAEVFYARAPTSVDGAGENIASWRRTTRSLMQHETKHLASFAERIKKGGIPSFGQDQWLEESSAMLAEEIWGRTVFGWTAKSNVTYRQTVYCELRVDLTKYPQCGPTPKPLNVLDHFLLLYDYLDKPEVYSIVGPVQTGDFTFYGAGWMFLRWVIDTYAPSESAFLKAMVADNVNPGVENIRARLGGKSFAELLSEFSIAIATDDIDGFMPSDVKYTIPSWNTREVFTTANLDLYIPPSQLIFEHPTPLQIHPSGFGKFTVDVAGVRGGGFSVIQLTGSQANKQLVEFKGMNGTNFPAEMRVNIVRVQ